MLIHGRFILKDKGKMVIFTPNCVQEFSTCAVRCQLFVKYENRLTAKKHLLKKPREGVKRSDQDRRSDWIFGSRWPIDDIRGRAGASL